MGCTGAQWFINGGVNIPDDDLFQRHLCSVPPKRKTSSNKTKLEAKDVIIKDTQIDTHLFDAFILTFAYPVKTESWGTARKIKKADRSRRQSPLKSVQRRSSFERGNQDIGSTVSASVSL